MPDQPSSADPGKEKRPLPRRKLNGNDLETKPRGDSGDRPSTPGRGPAKRKPPIVNRKGPSEVDRALKMSMGSASRSAPSGRKLQEGSAGRGTVVRIDRAKGFGFLVDSAGEERFFHRSAVLEEGFASLKEQQNVEFQVHNDERGARALKVRPSTSQDRPVASRAARPSPKTPQPTAWRSNLSPFRNGTSSPTAPAKPRGKSRFPKV